MNKKAQRRKEYEIALNLIEESPYLRICWSLDCPIENPSKIGCPVRQKENWDELRLFFEADYSMFFSSGFENLSAKHKQEIRIIVLLFCIQMTK